MKTIRVGLAGAGFAGHIHSRSLILAKGSHMSSKVSIELVAVTDKDSKRADAIAQQFGWQHVEKTWADLFKHHIDLLIVALPNGEHVDIVKKASATGIAILLEKPVARTYGEALEILEATKENPRIRVAYVNRFVPATQRAKLFIDAGGIGDIRNVRSVYLLNMRRKGIEPDWRFSEALAGHGASDDLGSHHIDLINFLAGDVVAVQAASRIWDIVDAPPATNDDAMNALLTLRNGGFGTFSASRTSPGHPLTGYIEIEGSKGALRVDRAYLNDLFIRDESGTFSQQNIRPVDDFATLWAAPTVQGAHPFSWYDCFAFQMTEMIQIAAEIPLETTWSATLYDGVKAMATTEAMINSIKAKKSQRVKFP